MTRRTDANNELPRGTSDESVIEKTNITNVAVNSVPAEFINKIVLGDCLEVFKQFPDSCVDMTFCDPPYNLGKKYKRYADSKNFLQYIEWCKKWLHQMVRVTKPTGSIFLINIPKWLTYFACYLNEEATFRHWIAWNEMASPLGKTLLPNHYGILWYVKSNEFKFRDIRGSHPRCRVCGELLADYGGKKDQIHPFGTLMGDVWTDIHRIKHASRRDEHPCQLPIHLLERLILMVTDENDVVLDPMVGTGTACVAAKRLGRRYVGIDLDEKYVQIAERNVKNANPTLINGVYVSVFLNRIITVRDEDYDKIKDDLKTIRLRVNRNREKILTLPFLEKRHRIEHKNPKQLTLPMVDEEPTAAK